MLAKKSVNIFFILTGSLAVILGVIGIILLLSISVLCFFSGCGSNSNSAGISTAEYDHAGSEGYTPPESGIEQTEDSKQPDNINIEQKIIKNGSLTIETSDLSQAEENIASLTEKYEGYINDSNLNILKSKKEVFMTVKVPEKNFEKFYEEIKEIGNVERSQIGTRDVTTEYIDLKARLGVPVGMPHQRFILEKLIPLLVDLLPVRKSASYTELAISLLERAANKAGIKRFKVYRYDVFEQNVITNYQKGEHTPLPTALKGNELLLRAIKEQFLDEIADILICGIEASAKYGQL